ncbi:MAG: hypothetical protein ACLP5V_11195 [Candidatus Bathyarchaeia archaeon]
MNTKTRKLTLVALLAVVSIVAIQPALVHATSQSVTIIARGSATPTTSAVSSSARIYLKGMANLNGGSIQFTQMTGIFQIGPVFYTITGGQGQTNSQTSTLQLNLQVGGSHPGSLVLQGTATISGAGYAVLFTPQQSNLENQYSLWLYGNLAVTPAPYP